MTTITIDDDWSQAKPSITRQIRFVVAAQTKGGTSGYLRVRNDPDEKWELTSYPAEAVYSLERGIIENWLDLRRPNIPFILSIVEWFP